MATLEGGQATIGTNGDFTYTPPADFTGDDSFDYTLLDDSNGSDTGTVTISVAPPAVIVSDDFNDASLDGMWSLEGPVGSANVAVTGDDSYLGIVVPDGGTYDAWGANNTTARVMQAASDEAFANSVPKA